MIFFIFIFYKGADYEIYPYATFSLPSQPVGHSMQFQTFNQHDCYEGRPVKEYPCARVRKPSSSNSPPDGLSLGNYMAKYRFSIIVS